MSLIGAVAATAVATAVLASSELTGPGVIRITDRELSRSTVDLGAAGMSPGDQLVVSQLLFNKRLTTTSLGHGEMVCTYLGSGGAFGGGSRQCTASYFLPRGKITVQGIVHNLFFFELSVVGGTGIYNNVRGTLTVTFLGGNPRRELLLFRLTV